MNRFSEFKLSELILLRSNLLSSGTFGLGPEADKLFNEVDREYDIKEKARKDAIPKCAKCGHDIK